MNAVSNPTGVAAGVTESLRVPHCTVTDGTEAYELRVNLPGVPKSGVTLELEGNALTVRGKRASALPPGWKVVRRELSPQGYQLRLRLNLPVDESRLEAHYENGVLTVRLPLSEAAKPRQITVE
jgi:HSP20 family protein